MTENKFTPGPDERDAFEAWYCVDAASNGLTFYPAEIKELRDGNHYGFQRGALNGKWEMWQAFSPMQRAAPELYAALQHMVEAFDGPFYGDNSIYDYVDLPSARQALSRARGQVDD